MNPKAGLTGRHVTESNITLGSKPGRPSEQVNLGGKKGKDRVETGQYNVCTAKLMREMGAEMVR